jgi:hypothetical protein
MCTPHANVSSSYGLLSSVAAGLPSDATAATASVTPRTVLSAPRLLNMLIIFCLAACLRVKFGSCSWVDTAGTSMHRRRLQPSPVGGG